MNIQERTDALMMNVSRKAVSEVFATAMNRAKRDNQRLTVDSKKKPEIIADCLLAVYRAGLYDGLSAAMEDFSDDGR